MAIGASYTVTCLVDGGLPPHQVQIVTPDQYQGKLFKQISSSHLIMQQCVCPSVCAKNMSPLKLKLVCLTFEVVDMVDILSEITQCSSGTKIWNNPSQSGDSLTCTGDNSLTCTVPVTASYATSGSYICKGYNRNAAYAVKTKNDYIRLSTGLLKICLHAFFLKIS